MARCSRYPKRDTELPGEAAGGKKVENGRWEGEEILFMGWSGDGAGVPCIDSTSFSSANEWPVFCPQMYGNAGRELFLNIRRYR